MIVHKSRIAKENPYKRFLSSPAAKQWRRIGVQRRAGVATPLFSLYSRKSIGIGEIPDLRLLVDWAVSTGLSLIQLLPMNDVGFNFRPYDAESSFALDPMYLSLEKLKGARLVLFQKKIDALRIEFPQRNSLVNYRVKQAKLDLLWEIFLDYFEGKSSKTQVDFNEYKHLHFFWLSDWAKYKVLKEQMRYASWEEWPLEFKNRQKEALRGLEKKQAKRLEFYNWLQWQLWSQFCDVKRYAQSKRVFLMGDLPFLVARDSADVWAHPDYFKLDYAAGAPPDNCFAGGQIWGMPPYNWPNISEHRYDYCVEKLKTAQDFYHLFRIDHFVGLFRLWTFPFGVENPQGFFDPKDESLWEQHGRVIVDKLVHNTSMLPCAEDLGTVPDCSYKVLKEFSIPGTEVQRWSKKFRPNSMAVISNHDVAPLSHWWEFEAQEEEKIDFWKYLGLRGSVEEKATPRFVKAALLKINKTASIFSIQLLQDWLSLGDQEGMEAKDFRINFPGTMNDKNWAIVMPFSLEEMLNLAINKKIREINLKTNRV